MINPAMHRHPAEAIIIGRIVVAFGEIEYMVCLTAAHAIDQLDPTLKALYRLRATSSRIEAADAFMAVFFGPSDLSADYQAMISAVRRCLRIRNQYAHCNWADHWNSPGVFFADLQESAAAAEGFEHEWKHVDVALLTEQEAFFSYTLDWLYYLDTSMAVRKGKLRSHAFPKPTERAPPPPHNPPLQHVPPWLDEDRKALHIARAQAALGGVPTPTPKQQALDAARAEKRGAEASGSGAPRCCNTFAPQSTKEVASRSRREPTTDSTYYAKAIIPDKYPDVLLAIENDVVPNATTHYTKHGYFENRMPYRIEVDADWYLKEYPDIGAAIERGEFASAQDHFEIVGFAEGRFPYRNFTLNTISEPGDPKLPSSIERMRAVR